MVDQSQDNTYKYVGRENDTYVIKREQIPKPGPGEVLIKIHYATINPYDKYLYYVAKLNRVGSEGSGTIAAVGDGLSSELVGKKVGFAYEAWAQYKVAKAGTYFLLDDS